MKNLLICLLPATLAAMAVAQPVDIPAPDGVGDVVALTNALTRSDLYDTIRLAPGVYDLSDVAMEEDSHLVMQSGRRLIGLGTTPGETVLRGGGAAVGRRIAQFGYANYSYATASNLTFTGGYIAGGKDDGAIRGGASTLVQDCIFSNNVCGGSWHGGGGGVYGARAERCLFIDNKALGTDIGGREAVHGGGLWCNNDHNLREDENWQGAYDCIFSNCVAQTRGGGLYGGRAEGCTFVGGQAYYGGGVSGTRACNSVFDGNRATSWATAADRATLDHCLITNHQAGAYVLLNCNLNGCTIVDNACAETGGVSCDTWRAELASATAAYTNANCVFRGNKALLASIVADKTCLNCTFIANEVGANYGTVVNPATQSPLVNCVFLENRAGDRLTDFNKGLNGRDVPFLTNCVYSAADVDPQTSARCADCFPANRTQLRFTRRFAATRPFEPRRVSPLVNRAFAPTWLTEALGVVDVYGNPRVRFGGLDIGAAECADLGPGGLLVIR